jgi:hypothetical protein
MYQCPDCRTVHEEATEPAIGIFVRCPECLLEDLLRAEAPRDGGASEAEPAPPRAA